VRELRETVSRFSGIQDQNAPARARQLKSGGQARKAASNNDYVVTHRKHPSPDSIELAERIMTKIDALATLTNSPVSASSIAICW